MKTVFTVRLWISNIHGDGLSDMLVEVIDKGIFDAQQSCDVISAALALHAQKGKPQGAITKIDVIRNHGEFVSLVP